MMMKFDFKNWLMMLAMVGVLMACGGEDEGDPEPDETDVCVVEGKTTVIVTVPENTPESASIYLVGGFNEWTTGDNAYKLNKRETTANTFCIAVNIEDGTEFKISRGADDWSDVEKADDCSEITNRVFEAPDDNTLELEVAKWADIDECG